MTILDDSVVDNLILQAREMLDEANTTDVSDAEILRAMNRGLKRLNRIATRKQPAFFKREVTFALTDFTSNYITLPEASFGLIVNEVHAIVNGIAYQIEYATSMKTANIETGATASIGSYYTIRGDKLYIYPTPNSSSTTYRVRYQLRMPTLVKQQGRIVTVDTDNEILTLDALGSDLTTSIDDLKAFINVIDGTTGDIKETYQVASIDTSAKTLSLKTSSLDRSTVFGRTVSTAIGTTIAQDDYVTIANGTCIATFVKDYDDYLIAHAVLDVKRSKGEDTNAEYAHFKEVEKDIEKMWTGRPSKMRVSKRNQHWGGSSNLLSKLRRY